MDALSYARKNVFFWQTDSPIGGKFDDSKYPLVRAQLESLSNAYCKCSVHYGPTQSIKTVLLEIFAAYLLDFKRKSLLAVSQTDDDAREFATIKLTPALERWGALKSTLRQGRYSATLSHWLWPTHELIISGPGPNAQNSKSAPYVLTDEAHLWNIAYPGALVALDDRMGLRWDRRASHFTTAADSGSDIDKLFMRGAMNEWNIRCPDCNQLFEPLWEQNSKDKYNGHLVFVADGPMETAPLDSIRMRCPYCDKRDLFDHPRLRKEMDEGADYVPSNPAADKSIDSFRWNAFGPRWKRWRDLMAIYQAAIASAKLGDLAPYENWIKKQLVQTWTGDFPLFGASSTGGNYDRVDVDQPRDGSARVCSFDLQTGKEGEGGFHLWAQVDEFDIGGASRRVDYQRLTSWGEARSFQEDHHAPDRNTGCDFGHRDREVFGKCAEYHWLALKSGDEENFPHRLQTRGTGMVTVIYLPYSEDRLELVTGILPKGRMYRGNQRHIPPGYCKSKFWSKPQVYALMHALKSGTAGREYGIARDINPLYGDQFHSYIPFSEVDKKTAVPKKTVWRKIRVNDHSWQTSCMNLILANQAGYYPLDMKSDAETAA